MKKKYILVFVFMGLFGASLAQGPGMMQRKMLPGKIDTLILNYLNYSKFSSLDDIGFSNAIAKQYQSLFVAGAKVADEVNPSFYDNNYERPFDLPIRTVDEYIAKTKSNYAAGLFVKFNAIQVDYMNLYVLLLKETNGTNASGLLYKITDTVKLKLNVTPDFKTVKIEDISVIGYVLILENDEDRDFVPNTLDKCPKEQGFRSGTGCFTKDEKVQFAIAEKERKRIEREKDLALNNIPVDKPKPEDNVRKEKIKKEKKKPNETPGTGLPALFLGFTLSAGNNNFTAPFDENNLGYTKMLKADKRVFSITELNKNKQAPSTQFQLDVDYFFGKKKNFGIATGIGFSGFNAAFSMDSFHVEYQATDGNGSPYRRIVRVHSMEEELKIRTLNIPLILQYKFDLGGKTNITLGLGMNYHSVASAKTNGSGTADYEAVYKFENGQAVYDEGNPPHNNSWLITRSNVEAHNGKSGEKEYFAQKKADGYDVAIDQSLTQEESLKLKSSFGSILRLNANFKLSEKLWFATLLQYQNLSFSNNSNNSAYQLTDKIGSYNSLLKNVNTLKVGALSFGIGLKFSIK